MISVALLLIVFILTLILGLASALLPILGVIALILVIIKMLKGGDDTK